jgi:hypothetical protein
VNLSVERIWSPVPPCCGPTVRNTRKTGVLSDQSSTFTPVRLEV